MLPTNMTHIFQLPLDWLEAVDAACFRASAGTLLSRRELADGGWCLDVDTDALADFAVKSTSSAYPSMSQFNSLSDTVAGLSTLDPETVAAVQRLIEEIGTGNILTTANVGTVVAPVSHNHTHSAITDWTSATQSFLGTQDVSNWGATAGLDYSGGAPVCCTNHGHLLSDIVDLDTQTELVTLDTDQTITAAKRFQVGTALWFSGTGYVWQQTASSPLTVRGSTGIALYAAANAVTLTAAPTVAAGNTTSRAVATCGWVNDTIPVSDFADAMGAVESIGYDSATGILSYSRRAMQYDGGIVQSGMDLGDIEIAVLPPESSVSPATSIPLVTGVIWNGTTLQFKSRAATIRRGVITALGNETTTTIDTPVAYNAT